MKKLFLVITLVLFSNSAFAGSCPMLWGKIDSKLEEIQKLRDDVSARVGVLERWRHVLIGGSIVVGFLLHKFMEFS